MPRSGDNWAPPASSTAIPNTTVSSAKFNAFLDDLTFELNLALPVARGGTGASNPTQARVNLDVYSTTEIDELVSSNQPIITAYATAGNVTHTFNERTVKFQVEGSGGGGAGGGTRVLDSQGLLQAGGNSGWFGKSNLLTKGEITEATLVIGAAGTSIGTSTLPEEDGKETTYSDGVNSFTWGGGKTMPNRVNAGNFVNLAAIQASTMSAGLRGAYDQGGKGVTNFTTGFSGEGGSTPYGAGGRPADATGNGYTGTGNGSGGSGCMKTSGTLAYNGGAGRPGIIIITEYLGAAPEDEEE